MRGGRILRILGSRPFSLMTTSVRISGSSVLCETVVSVSFIAELLCGRRPQKWSPILILRGMLVIFYGHGKRNGSRARAPYIRTYIAFHDILT